MNEVGKRLMKDPDIKDCLSSWLSCAISSSLHVLLSDCQDKEAELLSSRMESGPGEKQGGLANNNTKYQI